MTQETNSKLERKFIMLTTRKTAYAFICLGELYHLPEGEYLSISELAEKFDLSIDMLAQVLRKLREEL